MGKENIEISFEEVLCDNFLYTNYNPKVNHLDEKDFEVGDYIIYFRGNYTWRAEVVKRTKTGYIVNDY